MEAALQTVKDARSSVAAELGEMDIKYHSLKAKLDAYDMAITAMESDIEKGAKTKRTTKPKTQKATASRMGSKMEACLLFIHQFDGHPSTAQMAQAGHDVEKYMTLNNEQLIELSGGDGNGSFNYRLTDVARRELASRGKIPSENDESPAQQNAGVSVAATNGDMVFGGQGQQ